LTDPLEILGDWQEKKGARPGLRLLMVSTTGEQYAYYVLDEESEAGAPGPARRLRRTVDCIDENCEPSLCSVLFMGGAGGSACAPASPRTRCG
jgi:hypothetical protein